MRYGTKYFVVKEFFAGPMIGQAKCGGKVHKVKVVLQGTFTSTKYLTFVPKGSTLLFLRQDRYFYKMV